MSEPLTILGRGDSWKSCPFVGEIWACGTVLVTDGMKDKRYDKVFAMDIMHPAHTGLASSYEVAKERNIPFISIYDYATEKYPLEDIFNDFHTQYLMNTVSYMLALAIHQGRNPLSLYGVDQEDGMYSDGKPVVAFWLGVATGRGIKYDIANESMPGFAPCYIQSDVESIGEEWKVREEETIMVYGFGCREHGIFRIMQPVWEVHKANCPVCGIKAKQVYELSLP